MNVYALSPGSASGEAPFEQLVSATESAERLRRDLWVFSQLCRAAEGHLRNEDVTSAEAVISSIVAFLGYFQDGSYQLLRYVDYEAFDRFSRADPSRARDTGGAGLGLAIARGLVEAHGGEVWIGEPPGGVVGFRLPA